MDTGTYISGLAHVAILSWALIGGLFLRADDQLPAQVSEVSLISDRDFAALILPDAAPVTDFVEPVVRPPALPEARPQLEPSVDAVPAQAEPADVVPPTPESPPEQVEPALITPALIADDAPELPVPPSSGASAAIDPVADASPKPAAAPRIAALAAPEAPPDSDIAETATPEVIPDQTAEQTAEEKPATAPQQAATEIVTEAETPAGSVMDSSRRPISRPPRPKVSAPTNTETQDQTIADALAAVVANDQPPTDNTPAGPPMTGSDKDGFRIAVRQCWVVDVGSRAADVTVTVGFSLDQAGKVIGGSLKMIDYEGGDGSPVKTAFEAARRAILRCQKTGYDLPIEKYSQWRDVEMTFNPKNMRIK